MPGTPDKTHRDELEPETPTVPTPAPVDGDEKDDNK